MTKPASTIPSSGIVPGRTGGYIIPSKKGDVSPNKGKKLGEYGLMRRRVALLIRQKVTPELEKRLPTMENKDLIQLFEAGLTGAPPKPMTRPGSAQVGMQNEDGTKVGITVTF